MKFLALFMAVAIGCGAAAPVPKYSYVPDELYKVEDKPLPARPDATPIPADKDYAYPLVAGDSALADGILISPDKAARIKLWQIDYNELAGLYDADRKMWVATRALYDERLRLADDEIARLQPGWWDRHKDSISGVGGFVIGTLITVGIVYGVNQASK